MAAKIATQLETRTARAKIAAGRRLAVRVAPGIHLLYRRSRQGAGTWQARRRSGDAYRFTAIGYADDMSPADGYEVLDYFDACARARQWAMEAVHAPATAEGRNVRTVGDALDYYLRDFEKQRKRGLGTVRSAINRAIRPELGDLPLNDLTAEHIRHWMHTMERRGRALRARRGKNLGHLPGPTDPDAIRARRVTVNRQLGVLRAALNLAFRDEIVASDLAWRRVQPFAKVDMPRVRFLTPAESVALVAACPPDLRALVRAALLTGARFGELAAATVADFEPSTGQFYIARSKSGRPRHVPLNGEGVALFHELTEGREPSEPLLPRESGSFWGAGDYRRALEAACDEANIAPAIKFHELRHTYASLLAQAGCDLLTISKLVGHADTRITSRHYAHLCDKTLRAAVTHLPAFVGVVTSPPPASNVIALPLKHGRRRA